MENGFAACVTADADGQHSCKNIMNVISGLKQAPQALILGVRNTESMPRRLKRGNTLTRALFSLLYGITLTDTQTEVRGIPFTNGQALLALKGDRYEYEMNMLIYAKELFANIISVPIDTIYIKNNALSDFRLLQDGLLIYLQLFKRLHKFLLSSFFSFCVDYFLFNSLYYWLNVSTMLSTVIARFFSATFNYTVNKH